MSSIPLWFGWVSVILAILTFGSYGLPAKMKRIRKAKISQMVFQLPLSLIIFISSFLVLTYNKWEFTYLGIVGPALWVPASCFALLAISKIGVSIGQSIWSAVTIGVSFVWGSILPGHTPKNQKLSIVFVIFLILGVSCFGFIKPNQPDDEDDEDNKDNEDNEDNKDNKDNKDNEDNEDNKDDKDNKDNKDNEDNKDNIETIQSVNNIENNDNHERINIIENIDNDENSEEERRNLRNPRKRVQRNVSKKDFIIGILSAITCGLLNGSMMVPLSYVPSESNGIIYIVSFGIGTIIVTPIVFFIFYFIGIIRNKCNPTKKPFLKLSDLKIKKAMIPGMISGIFWSLGNFFATYATLSPLGMSQGFSLTQLAVVVAALWGIFVFKEISGKKNLIIFSSVAITTLVFAMLLGIYG
ncbi:transmembrane protein [Anaeramoeba ignava]|uniref:Transmembrane protein n=1 Tax=Anaeramoeba ignava TaxID=1746090 RepID=A0A9Q0R5Y5_ANAIG|nr:transmembrane protein [Anaeramoeba ignava]